ncbi:probable disease resistance protein At1g62630 [Trifolium pratense]|uniref:probable disease resistance protein At1g62630 n=1 Tax=Trifolium pratense TaxID=57577 RepID=UPI001E692C58|nr:probable disease resistance protein At1g62630 [Trifolium pratense]
MLNEIMMELKNPNNSIIGVYGMGGVRKTKLVEQLAWQAKNELRQRISNEKSILIILDDIWGKLDLTEVGIPFGDDHKGCKLLVTSRSLNVLNSNMDIRKEFRLEVLLVSERTEVTILIYWFIWTGSPRHWGTILALLGVGLR